MTKEEEAANTLGRNQAEVEAANIEKYGTATPYPQTGELTQFTTGFGTDLTGRIFKLGEGSSEPVISSEDVSTEFDQLNSDLDDRLKTINETGDGKGTSGGESGTSGDGAGDPFFREEVGRIEADKSDTVADDLAAWQVEQEKKFEEEAAARKAEYELLFQTSLVAVDETAAATIAGIQATYDKRINEQRRINNIRIDRVKAYGLGSGNARFNPIGYTDAVTVREEEAADAIAALEGQRNALIAKAKAAAREGRADLLRQRMDDLTATEDRLNDQLAKIKAESDKQYEILREYRKEQEREHEEALEKMRKNFALLASSFLDEYNNADDAGKRELIRKIMNQTGLDYAEIYGELERAAADAAGVGANGDDLTLRTIGGNLYQITRDKDGNAVARLVQGKGSGGSGGGSSGGGSSSSGGDSDGDGSEVIDDADYSMDEPLPTFAEFERALAAETDDDGNFIFNESNQELKDIYDEYIAEEKKRRAEASGGGGSSEDGFSERVTTDSRGKSLSNAKQTAADAKVITDFLDSVSGSDGYVSPSDYAKAKKKWVSFGYSAEDFDRRYRTSYANPSNENYTLE